MNNKTLLFSCIALVCAQSAQAAGTAPVISGSYLLSITTFCSAVGSVAKGDYVYDTGIAKFDPAAGTVSVAGNGFNASVVIPNSTAGDVSAAPFKISNQPYSNTATEITLGSQVARVVYGAVKGGIAQQFNFYSSGTQNSTPPPTKPNCITTGTASHI